MHSQFVLSVLALSLACSIWDSAYADDAFVKAAKSMSARDFDRDLPNQSVEAWLRALLPIGYKAVWGEEITDCGEGGGAVIEGRDMPLCAEVQLMRGDKMAGYLALMVGTEKGGLLKEGSQLYFGYFEYAGVKYNFKRLSDVLKVK